MSTLLLLATPDATSNKMEFKQVTLANYRTCASLYVKSKTAELPSQPEILTTGRLLNMQIMCIASSAVIQCTVVNTVRFLL